MLEEDRIRGFSHQGEILILAEWKRKKLLETALPSRERNWEGAFPLHRGPRRNA